MQKLLKATIVSGRQLIRMNSFYFADAKKIPELWEISIQARVEMGNALLGAYSCRQFAYLLKENF
jgi:hypothetical protein